MADQARAVEQGVPRGQVARRWGLRLVKVILVGVVFASIAGHGGALHWGLDLFSHFRLQYALLLGATTLAALWLGHRSTLALSAGIWLLSLLPLLPLFRLPEAPAGPGLGLRIVHFNVLTSNWRVEEAAAWIARQNADIVVVQEVDRRWADGLDAGLKQLQRLPTDTVLPHTLGIAVYVGKGNADVTVETVWPVEQIPAIVLGWPQGERTLTLYTIHIMPMLGDHDSAIARQQVAWAVDALISRPPGPVILVGDLNATFWSVNYRLLTEAGALHGAAEGRGLVTTWPSFPWLSGLIGIDQLLLSDDIRVESFAVGPHLGSDHRPLTVDLTILP